MIAFSGIDCAGKTTQIDLLTDVMEKSGDFKCQVVWSRGGYTPFLQLLKDCVAKSRVLRNRERSTVSEQVLTKKGLTKVLFVASLIDLWIYYSIVLRVKELFGVLVICDRYFWDTYIDFVIKYPQYEFDKGFWWKLTARTMLKPTVSMVLTISADESIARSELKNEPFPESVSQRMTRIGHYHDEIAKGKWDHVIDASRSIAAVHSDILDVVQKKYMIQKPR